VSPEDFRHAVERTIVLNPKDVDVAVLFGSIEGAQACSKDPSSCDLSDAIVGDADAVTFHLSDPDPDLPFKLAMPWAYPVPVATPVKDQGLNPVPATGPYMIAEAGADGIELARNPAFREWSGAAQPDGFVEAISWRFQEKVARAFDRLSAGELDWMTGPPRTKDLAALQASHPGQVVAQAIPSTIFLGVNLRRPPFDDRRVRQALNYAIDRDHVVEFWGPTNTRPTCQILPPNLQGYEPFCPYTLEPDSGVWSAPDVDRARALFADAEARGEKVTVLLTDYFPDNVETMRYVVHVMDDLGLRANLEIVHDYDKYLSMINTGKPQAYITGWASIYPSAADFLPPNFRCGAPFNISGLCNEVLDAAMDEAQRLPGTDPAAANSAWIEIEHRLVKDAIWVPLWNNVSTFAFSARAGNIQIHPQWGVLPSRLWVQ
jgi:peptide/nickel transport system substrate-binding protein